MKLCNTCKQRKEYSDYYKDSRGREGLYASCKSCHQKFKKKRRLKTRLREAETPLDVARIKMYCLRGRINSLPGYKNVKCLLSMQDMEDYIATHWDEYMKLFSAYKDSGFKRGLAPSIDRIDPSKDYSLDNIQIITNRENAAKDKFGKRLSSETKDKIREAMLKRRLLVKVGI